jgi:hypothetical protein
MKLVAIVRAPRQPEESAKALADASGLTLAEAIDCNGRGTFKAGKRVKTAHQVARELERGPVPSGAAIPVPGLAPPEWGRVPGGTRREAQRLAADRSEGQAGRRGPPHTG